MAMAEMDLGEVELEEDDLQEKSVEELANEYGSEAEEVTEEIDLTSGPVTSGGDVEKADVSPGGSIEVPDSEVDTDEELIKRTGMASFGIDSSPTEDEVALAELRKSEERGEEIEAGLREDTDVQSYVTDTFAKTHGDDGEEIARVSEMNKAEQAEHLAEEVAEVVDVDKIAERAANLPKTTENCQKTAESAVYEEITKFAEAMYDEGEISTEALKAVRDRFVTRAGRVAKVLSAG